MAGTILYQFRGGTVGLPNGEGTIPEKGNQRAVGADPCVRPCVGVFIMNMLNVVDGSICTIIPGAPHQAGRHMGRPLHFDRYDLVNYFKR